MSWSSRSLLIGILGLVMAGLLVEAWLRFAGGGRSRGSGVRAVLLFEEPKSVLFATESGERPSEHDREREIEFHMALLTSDAVLEPALARLGSVTSEGILKQQEDPRSWLRDHLVVEHREGTPVVEISLPHGMPEEQASLLNGILESLRRQASEVNQSARKAAIIEMRDYRQGLVKRIEHMESEILALARSGMGETGLSRSRSDLEAELTRIGLQRAEVRSRRFDASKGPGPAGTAKAEEPGHEDRLAILDATEKTLQARLEAIKKELAEQAANAAKRDFLERDIELLRPRAEIIDRRVDSLEFAGNRARSTFIVLETPSVRRRGPG